MSQVFRYSFDIIPRSDGGDSARMPKIMEAGIRSADLRHDFLEAVVYGFGDGGVCMTCRKNGCGVRL